MHPCIFLEQHFQVEPSSTWWFSVNSRASLTFRLLEFLGRVFLEELTSWLIVWKIFQARVKQRLVMSGKTRTSFRAVPCFKSCDVPTKICRPRLEILTISSIGCTDNCALWTCLPLAYPRPCLPRSVCLLSRCCAWGDVESPTGRFSFLRRLLFHCVLVGVFSLVTAPWLLVVLRSEPRHVKHPKPFFLRNPEKGIGAQSTVGRMSDKALVRLGNPRLSPL